MIKFLIFNVSSCQYHGEAAGSSPASLCYPLSCPYRSCACCSMRACNDSGSRNGTYIYIVAQKTMCSLKTDLLEITFPDVVDFHLLFRKASFLRIKVSTHLLTWKEHFASLFHFWRSAALSPAEPPPSFFPWRARDQIPVDDDKEKEETRCLTSTLKWDKHKQDCSTFCDSLSSHLTSLCN